MLRYIDAVSKAAAIPEGRRAARAGTKIRDLGAPPQQHRRQPQCEQRKPGRIVGWLLGRDLQVDL